MADSCFGRPDPGVAELDTFVEDALPPGAPLLPARQQPVAAAPQAGHLPQSPKLDPPPASGAAPLGGPPGAVRSGTSGEDAAFPLEQMRPRIEAGRLMVFGPGGDPVPPYAFAEAAAARPDALVRLPDGTSAPASRFAAVLGAQILGRLGEAEQGADWIVAMLRDGGRPEAGDQTTAGEQAQALADDADAVLATPQGDVSGKREAPDQAALDQAATCIEPSPESLPPLELHLEKLVASTDDLDFSADRLSAKAAEAEREVDPDSIVLVMMRGVPEGAVLSTGVRDDDGTWLLSPLDLSTVTISLAPEGTGRGADGNLSITGIALAENGELVAISETVPLADYLADPDAGQPART
jgi:hypothetical protein